MNLKRLFQSMISFYLFYLILIAVFHGIIMVGNSNNSSEFQEYQVDPKLNADPEIWIMDVYSPSDENFWTRASPAAYDVDQDGQDEIIVCFIDMYCIDPITKTIEWQFSGNNMYYSSPVIDDFDGDGKYEIVVGSGGNTVVCINGQNGTLKWQNKDIPSGAQTVPAIGDINNDGIKEMFIGVNDFLMYCIYGNNGTTAWTFKAENMIQGNPSVGDINGDGFNEVIFNDMNGNLYCIDNSGNELWNRKFSSGKSQNTFLLYQINNQIGLNVIFDDLYTTYIINGTSGENIWTFPHKIIEPGTLTIGDIDNDDIYELIIPTSNDVISLNVENCSVKWQYSTDYSVKLASLLCDFDGNSGLDVIISDKLGRIIVLEGTTGDLMTSLSLNTTLKAFPICSVIGDSIKNSLIYATNAGKLMVVNTNGNFIEQANPWPCFGGSRLHGSFFADLNKDGISDRLTLSMDSISGDSTESSSESKSSIPFNIPSYSLFFVIFTFGIVCVYLIRKINHTIKD